MANFNKVIMVGNLTRDPEYKEISSGQALCRLGLASNRQYRNRQTGNLVQEVCFIDIDVWGAQAESCRQYLQKGRAVLVEGRLKFESWQDNNGNNRNKHTIVADRVVFLSQSISESTGETTSYAKKDPSSQLEKELLDQIDQIKEKASAEETPKESKKEEAKEADVQVTAAKPEKKVAKKAAKKDEPAESSQDANKVGGVEFKDEAPFEDDLPF